MDTEQVIHFVLEATNYGNELFSSERAIRFITDLEIFRKNGPHYNSEGSSLSTFILSLHCIGNPVLKLPKT